MLNAIRTGRRLALLVATCVLPSTQAHAQGQSLLVLPVLSSTQGGSMAQLQNDLYPRMVVAAGNIGLFSAVKSGTFDAATKRELLEAQSLQRFDSPILVKTSSQFNVTTLLGVTISELTQQVERTRVKNETLVSYTTSYRLSMMLVDVQTGRVMASDSKPVVWVSGTSQADAAASSLGNAEGVVRGFLSGAIPWWLVDFKETDADGSPKVVLVKVGSSSWRELRPGYRLIVQTERPATLDPTTIVREQQSELEVVAVSDGVAECAVLSNGAKLRDIVDPKRRGPTVKVVVVRNPVQPKKK